MIIPVQVWVVVEEDGVVLVDAGIPSMAGGIMKFIEKLNAGPLKAIVLTHGHSDHVGAIPKIRERYPVPVYVHAIEKPFMEGEAAYPRRKKAAASLAKGIASPLPDTSISNSARFGSLAIHWTPGHSPGHVAFYHEGDGVLLAGDLFTAKKGQLRKPMAMFTADMAEAMRSSQIVRQLQPKRLEVCHGSSVLNPASQMERYLQQA
nr:MBL fold metallo-hydrolase [Paenibacillus phyllosphaerae]